MASPFAKFLKETSTSTRKTGDFSQFLKQPEQPTQTPAAPPEPSTREKVVGSLKAVFSPRSVARDVAKAARGTGEFALDVARATPRAGEGIIRDALGLKGFQPEGRVERLVFGDEYVPSYTERVENWVKTGRDAARAVGAPEAVGGAAGGLLIPLFAASEAFPILPAGAVKTVWTKLAGIRNVGRAKTAVKELGVADELLDEAAEAVVKADTPEAAESALREVARRQVGDEVIAFEDVLKNADTMTVGELSDAVKARGGVQAAEEVAPGAPRVIGDVAPSLQPVLPQVSGTTPSGPARDLADWAVRNELLSVEDAADVATFEAKRGQATIAKKIFDENPDRAMAIATGKELPPPDVNASVFWSEAKARAVAASDMDAISKLVKSPVATQVSEAGSTLGSFGTRVPGDAVGVLSDIRKIKAERAAARLKKANPKATISQARKQVVKDIEGEIAKRPSRQKLAEFIESIQC